MLRDREIHGEPTIDGEYYAIQDLMEEANHVLGRLVNFRDDLDLLFRLEGILQDIERNHIPELVGLIRLRNANLHVGTGLEVAHPEVTNREVEHWLNGLPIYPPELNGRPIYPPDTGNGPQLTRQELFDAHFRTIQARQAQVRTNNLMSSFVMISGTPPVMSASEHPTRISDGLMEEANRIARDVLRLQPQDRLDSLD